MQDRMSGSATGSVAWEVDVTTLTPSPVTGPQATAATTTRGSVPRHSPLPSAHARGGRAGGTGGTTAGALPSLTTTATAPRLSTSSTTAGSRSRPPPAGQTSGSFGTGRGGGAGGGGIRARGAPAVPTATRAVANQRPTTLVARRQDRPTAVVQSLHERQLGPRVTPKGRAVQQEMQALADDYFEGVQSRAPGTASPAKGNSGSLPHGVADSAFTSSALSRAKTFYTEAAIPRRWYGDGPTDAAGRAFTASESNLLCMDVLASPGASGNGAAVCVVGSADHGLKVFELPTLRERRTLFSRANGHTDWVTCCRFLPDGRVLSGGMDSKLCLWDSVLTGGGRGGGGGGGVARCDDLLGHTASVSQVEVSGDSLRAISAGYDRTLRVWDCSGARGGREVGLLAGHKAPVMHFDWCGIHVLSGDRQGQARVWDVERATCLCTMTTKRGQISSVQQLHHDTAGELVMFGDQGGVLTVLDLRQGKRPICQREAHPGGVVSGIRGAQHGGGGDGEQSGPYVVTCGADKRICVLDPRSDFAPVNTFRDHEDFIYSMETFGPLVVSGGGNGWVLVHDTRTGECCYGLGAGKNAIRDLFPSPHFLVAAGDDGKAVVYDF